MYYKNMHKPPAYSNNTIKDKAYTFILFNI